MSNNASAPLVRKTRVIFDEGTRQWFDEYEAEDLRGGKTHALVSREASQANEVAKPLRKNGAKLPRKGELLETAIVSAMESEAEIQQRAAHTGWYDGRHAFVTHLQIVGDARQEARVIPPDYRANPVVGLLAEKGVASDFLKKIAGFARHSSTLMLCLGAAFGAPLLRILNRQSFAIVLAGHTRGGKSSGLLIAASVEGFTAENHLPNLNATSAGLLALAPIFNDHVMPVNEVSAAKGAKKDIYLALREFTYQLVEGRDLLRHPSWNKSENTQSVPFYSIFLFSSEHTPDTWARRHGDVRDSGEIPRLIGLPAYRSGGATIFDCPPDGLKGRRLRDWEREQFRKIRERVERHSGKAMAHYAEYLVKHRKGLRKRARSLVHKFEEAVIRDNMSPETQQIATNFGVLFAGNMLAISAGLLPFKEAEVGSALKRCFKRTVENLPDLDETLKTGLKTLRKKLRDPGMILQTLPTKDIGKALSNSNGWRRKNKSAITYTIRANCVLPWLRDPLTRRLVLEWLDEQGFLEHEKRSPRKPGGGLDWAERQTLWPDGSRPRSIVITRPNGVDDLRL